MITITVNRTPTWEKRFSKLELYSSQVNIHSLADSIDRLFRDMTAAERANIVERLNRKQKVYVERNINKDTRLTFVFKRHQLSIEES